MAPYEALYGRRCRSPVCWDEPADVVGTLSLMVEETQAVIARIREHMRIAQDRRRMACLAMSLAYERSP